MAELKTKVNDASVIDYIHTIENGKRREDALLLMDYIKEITDETPKMWGDSIVGYGKLTYKYASGRTGEWMQFGFSPRKQYLTLYIPTYLENIPDLVQKVTSKHGKGCVYIKDLTKVNKEDVKELIEYSFKKKWTFLVHFILLNY